MKDKNLIIVASLLAVFICLLLTALLFFVVTPKFLVILALTIGMVTGVIVTSLIHYLVKTIRMRRSDNEN